MAGIGAGPDDDDPVRDLGRAPEGRGDVRHTAHRGDVERRVAGFGQVDDGLGRGCPDDVALMRGIAGRTTMDGGRAAAGGADAQDFVVTQVHPLGGADEVEVVDRPPLRVEAVDPALKAAKKVFLMPAPVADGGLGGLELRNVVGKGKWLCGDRLDPQSVGS